MEFARHPKGKYGVEGQCKLCRNAIKKEWLKNNTEQLKKKRERHKIWRKNSRDYVNFKGREWRAQNTEKVHDWNMKDVRREKARALRLKIKYNMTTEDYDNLLKIQDYRCAICRAHQDYYKSRFAVDHSHVSNKNRGALCVVCNRFICGVIDKRARSKNVLLTEFQFVENLYNYYKKAESA